MARQLDFLQIVITMDRDEQGALRRHHSIQYGVSDPAPASGKEFDKRRVTATGIPGYQLSNAVRDAVIAEVLPVLRTETST